MSYQAIKYKNLQNETQVSKKRWFGILDQQTEPVSQYEQVHIAL